ncbi:demethoxyubiquinone hydroxylase family protein [Candidatus Phycosocius spiralis]|uniref:3-demethoxyubiquinol 3-hydroxylase n=1 Tax=Candidatus Phycosocius spiralis TaxID=2815099 RepID=A0ABQ4PSY7_9PROT|nr:demethoxyubiquinone hydroxylase family protein [Candidatus Phycosocius spiralis]GIU66096.1 2-nonaprenyl-3-methyl-6-methoxy-1,4-benzoquinol hydroxylase [Candidatus Phycosocius spiralis]
MSEVKTGRAKRPPLPGTGFSRDRLKEMLRVDHAGEYGATRIYAGQRAVFSRLPGARRITAQLAEQEADEKVHKIAFDQLLVERCVRPTLLGPLWGMAGYSLGIFTALMGEKAAHACTAAVEEVIETHYRDQIEELGDREPELKAMITQFRNEEIAHKDQAIAEGAKDAFAHPILETLIKLGCKVAITVSQKL